MWDNKKEMGKIERYIIITPVRNEEKYLEETIISVSNQTIIPTEWIIVNDGSTDKTGDIIDKFSTQFPWIKAVHRENRGFRKAGGGVIEAFYDGYNEIEAVNYDYIIKLDGDLTFCSDYFERSFEKFKENPKLGVGGGDIHHLINGQLILEKNPKFHVRGATKIYKKDCWDAIGGLIMAPGWDTLDEVKANMLGWRSYSFPDLKVIHHRYTGTADGSWKNLVKNGRANYISGYHPLFMLIKCANRIKQKPYFIAAIALFWGFVLGYLKREPQVNDKKLIQYLRNQQLKRLFNRSSIWK